MEHGASRADTGWLRMPAAVLEAVRRAAEAGAPEEVCGGLFGPPALAPGRRSATRAEAAPNAAPGDRRRRFAIAPASVLGLEGAARAEGLDLVGFYHSHPAGPPVPSGSDLEAAWPWYSYLIVGPADGRWTARSWRLSEETGRFEEEQLIIEDGVGVTATVRVPAPLRGMTEDRAEIEIFAATVGGALKALAERYPGIRRHLWSEDGRLRAYVNLYLNEEDVRFRGGPEAPLDAGDMITIVPSIAGGGLSPAETARYSRHLALPEVGPEGQEKLKAGRVLLVGAGGLGSPAALYLTAAGVGTLGIAEFDVVDETNLQRQVLFGTGDLGRAKLEAAADRLYDLNPHVEVRPHPGRLTGETALEIVEEYDLVVDGTDNFPTRYLVNDACALLGRPYVYGSIFRFEGQVSVFDARSGPCYRCLFREPPPPGLVPSCAEGGVLGVLPGIIGSLQALEAIKLILGTGDTLLGRLLLFDALALRWRELKLRKNPDCPLCGEAPTITALIDYDAFCGLRSTAAPAYEEIPEIDVQTLKRRLDAGERPVLVDVRQPYEWQAGNLARWGARLIPLGELDERLGELDPGAETVLYCRSGGRSENAARRLRAAGFRNLINLRGGMVAWDAEVGEG
jgi:sulfur-carrier protein adenylyltransferase/sulfurtransferase